MSHNKRILVSPLNWGLGHATRCIPIIKEFQRQGAEVILASDGFALELLRQEFPELVALELPAYQISYSWQNMVINMALQFPKIISAVLRENRDVTRYITKYKIDGILSDSRFGCYSDKVRSAFLTHQINIQSGANQPKGVIGLLYKIGESVTNSVNRRLISRFDECWIPDLKGELNLSGALSHDLNHNSMGLAIGKVQVNYIGALTRMQQVQCDKKYDIAVVLSGPEPQRTHLEKIIIEQAKAMNQNFLIVQGIGGLELRKQISNNIECVSFLTSERLNEAIMSAGYFIGRSGYSTIMDLSKLGKQAILIPTPGQTEQEYIAKRFAEKKVFVIQKQNQLDLKAALADISQHAGLKDEYENSDVLRTTVKQFLAHL